MSTSHLLLWKPSLRGYSTRIYAGSRVTVVVAVESRAQGEAQEVQTKYVVFRIKRILFVEAFHLERTKLDTIHNVLLLEFRCLFGFEGSGDLLELVLPREQFGAIEVSFRVQQNILTTAH